jgi:diaminopimelate epimerase
MIDGRFVKMHGLGNDFVLLDLRPGEAVIDRDLAIRIAERHTGIGCDQLLLIGRPCDPAAEIFLRFINSDGSEPEACGNGTRCAASYLIGDSERTAVTIQTVAGLLPVSLNETGFLTVNMGKPRFAWNEIPLARECDSLAVTFATETFSGAAACTNMGNPHATFFVPDLGDIDIARVGRAIETHEMFPEKVNVGFAEMADRRTMKFRVWERGTGITLACGSAACAAVVAACRRGIAERAVEVQLERGSLFIEWRPDHDVHMSGPATVSFTGRLDSAWLRS